MKTIFKSTEPTRTVIVLKHGELSDEQLTAALRVGPETPWWCSLVQLIEKYRTEHATAAGQQAAINNALAMAAHAGVYDVLSELLDDLESRRSSEG